MEHNPSEPRPPRDRSQPSSSPETRAKEDEDSEKYSPYPEDQLFGGSWPQKQNDAPDDYVEWSPYPPSRPLPPQSSFSKWGLPIGLFVLTVFTTLWAGAYQPYFLPTFRPKIGPLDLLFDHPEALINGIPFAATLLTILITHEFGHYLFSRVHKIPASFPLFIPGPPHFIGTFGAIIRMRSPIMNRRALFDIGVAGPIAGFVIALPALILGLSLSEIQPQDHYFGIKFGDPLLFQFLGRFILGPIPPNHDIGAHPIAIAAWFGLFVTALNLLPIGQLDGGHVTYALFGKRQRTLALSVIPILLILGFIGWSGWFVWVGLAGLIGVSHPPVTDPHTSLGRLRIWIGWLALGIFFLSFSPVPFYWS